MGGPVSHRHPVGVTQLSLRGMGESGVGNFPFQTIRGDELKGFLTHRGQPALGGFYPRGPTGVMSNYELPTIDIVRGGLLPPGARWAPRRHTTGLRKIKVAGQRTIPGQPLSHARLAGGCSHRSDGTMCGICEDIARLDRKTRRAGMAPTIAARRSGQVWRDPVTGTMRI